MNEKKLDLGTTVVAGVDTEKYPNQRPKAKPAAGRKITPSFQTRVTGELSFTSQRNAKRGARKVLAGVRKRIAADLRQRGIEATITETEKEETR